MKLITKIRNYIKNGKYEVTEHADKEAQEDDVSISDIKNAILNGEIVKKYTHDPRGAKYKILGKTLDNQDLFVICKFNDIQEVKIITVFIKEEP